MKTRRIACITAYVKDSKLVRTSIVINGIQNGITERLFFSEDWFAGEDFRSEEVVSQCMDKVTTKYIEQSVQFDAEIRMISEPVNLKKCACGACNGYLTNEICADDLEKMEESYSKQLH